MRAASQQPEAEWNIMVYMAADDVLANFAIESVKQLRRRAGKDVVVAVQLDVDGPFARQRLRRFIFDGLITPDAEINLDVVATLDPATNMIDPKTLLNGPTSNPGAEPGTTVLFSGDTVRSCWLNLRPPGRRCSRRPYPERMAGSI